MTERYTPTLDEVRLTHAESVTLHQMTEPLLSEANAMFDRFLAAERLNAVAATLEHLRNRGIMVPDVDPAFVAAQMVVRTA